MDVVWEVPGIVMCCLLSARRRYLVISESESFGPNSMHWCHNSFHISGIYSIESPNTGQVWLVGAVKVHRQSIRMKRFIESRSRKETKIRGFMLMAKLRGPILTIKHQVIRSQSIVSNFKETRFFQDCGVVNLLSKSHITVWHSEPSTSTRKAGLADIYQSQRFDLCTNSQVCRGNLLCHPLIDTQSHYTSCCEASLPRMTESGKNNSENSTVLV